MPFNKWISRIRSSDIQAKIVLILIAVIFPLSILIGLIQSKVMEPILSEEIRQLGISFSQNLSSQIQSQKQYLAISSGANNWHWHRLWPPAREILVRVALRFII